MYYIKTISRKIVFFIGLITSIALIALLLGFFYMKVVKPEPADFSFNDGPYLFHLNDSVIKSIIIKDNPAGRFSVSEFEFMPRDSVGLSRAARILPEGFNPSDSFEKSPVGKYRAERIAAISDIHGSFHYFEALLKANEIIDDASDWKWGSGHLVIIGDVFDKGPYVTECLWLIKKLENQAEENGGKVHFLLGNHECLILKGNTSHVDIKYRSICEKLSIEYDRLYGADSYLGRWLRSKNAAIEINNNLFVHGGISEGIIDNNFILNDINNYFSIWAKSAHLLQYDVRIRNLLALLIDQNNPLEYKGYFNNNLFNRGQSSTISDQSINRILCHFDAKHIIVGHTIVREIRGFFDNKIIAVNVGFPEDDILVDDSDCQMLIIEGNNYFEAEITGEKKLLFSE